jgi:hypothetical protein
MEITSYSFGDVISYKGEEYVFLAVTDDSIFLAKILSIQDTAIVTNIDKRISDNGSPHTSYSLSVCFVVLKTQEFRDRAVFYGRTEYPFDMFTNKLTSGLNLEDLKVIKKEILESKATAQILKDKMEEIELEDRQ